MFSRCSFYSHLLQCTVQLTLLLLVLQSFRLQCDRKQQRTIKNIEQKARQRETTFYLEKDVSAQPLGRTSLMRTADRGSIWSPNNCRVALILLFLGKYPEASRCQVHSSVVAFSKVNTSCDSALHLLYLDSAP